MQKTLCNKHSKLCYVINSPMGCTRPTRGGLFGLFVAHFWRKKFLDNIIYLRIKSSCGELVGVLPESVADGRCQCCSSCSHAKENQKVI